MYTAQIIYPYHGGLPVLLVWKDAGVIVARFRLAGLDGRTYSGRIEVDNVCLWHGDPLHNRRDHSFVEFGRHSAHLLPGYRANYRAPMSHACLKTIRSAIVRNAKAWELPASKYILKG